MSTYKYLPLLKISIELFLKMTMSPIIYDLPKRKKKATSSMEVARNQKLVNLN